MTPSRSSTAGWAKYFFTGGASVAVAETGQNSIAAKSNLEDERHIAGSFHIGCG